MERLLDGHGNGKPLLLLILCLTVPIYFIVGGIINLFLPTMGYIFMTIIMLTFFAVIGRKVEKIRANLAEVENGE
jgi:hypothetical protein